jgi:hypothetical protein
MWLSVRGGLAGRLHIGAIGFQARAGLLDLRR